MTSPPTQATSPAPASLTAPRWSLAQPQAPPPASREHSFFRTTSKTKTNQQLVDPVGVLAVHIKKCKNIRGLDTKSHFNKSRPMNLYVQIEVSERIKKTRVIAAPTLHILDANMDDVKLFSLKINNHVDDHSNRVFLTLYGYQDHNSHHVIADKEIHLFNIIRKQQVSESFEFYNNSQYAGEVEIDFVFKYGCFGYGYSSQLENKVQTRQEQTDQSLFYRPEPPSERTLEGRDVMAASNVSRPQVIQWTSPEMSQGVRQGHSENSHSTINRSPVQKQWPALQRAMEPRMTTLLKDYSACKSRSERLTFIKELLTDNQNQEEQVCPIGTEDTPVANWEEGHLWPATADRRASLPPARPTYREPKTTIRSAIVALGKIFGFYKDSDSQQIQQPPVTPGSQSMKQSMNQSRSQSLNQSMISAVVNRQAEASRTETISSRDSRAFGSVSNVLGRYSSQSQSRVGSRMLSNIWQSMTSDVQQVPPDTSVPTITITPAKGDKPPKQSN